MAKHQTRGFAKERAAKKVSLRENFNEEVNYIMENIYG